VGVIASGAGLAAVFLVSTLVVLCAAAIEATTGRMVRSWCGLCVG
jgi:hypothetical protein